MKLFCVKQRNEEKLADKKIHILTSCIVIDLLLRCRVPQSGAAFFYLPLESSHSIRVSTRLSIIEVVMGK